MPAQPQLETILQGISDGFASYDHEWRYVYVNEKAAQMMGRTKEELIGKSLFELFPDRIDTPVFREFQRIMEEGKPAQLDYFSPGAQRWLRTNFYPTADGMTTFFTDITPERKLEETTRLLHTLTQNMLDAVIMTDIDYRITGWNQGAEILYGWRADEVIGQPANAVLQTQIPDNPDGRQEWLRVIMMTGSWQGEVIQKRRDESAIHILASVARVEDADKTVIGYIAVNRDITGRKRAEASLLNSEAILAAELTDMQQLQRISSQMISEQNVEVLYEKVLDAVMLLMHADMGSLQMLYPEKNQLFLLTQRGFASESAAFWQWVGADTSSICAEAMRTHARVIAPDVETLDYIVNSPEVEFFRLSGIRGVVTTPLVTRTRSVVGMISTHWHTVHEPSERELRILDVLARQTADIIQNAQAEHLRQARERELAVLEERQRFAREVHDGASQSIFAANVAIETVQRIWSRKPERALEMLDQIHHLTTGAVAEMRMLLLELRPENVVKSRLSDLLAFQVQVVQMRRGITVSLDIDDKYDFSLPEAVHFVFYRIAQESLNNIAKHAGAKKARIRIRPVGDQVELTIVDNGSGFIPRPELSGFGLTSMKERAESIGAAFRIQSRVKTGTRVRLLWSSDSVILDAQKSHLG